MKSLSDQKSYDAVVIGAGIVGAMIARELSRYEGRFALLEKERFSGFGVSSSSKSNRILKFLMVAMLI